MLRFAVLLRLLLALVLVLDGVGSAHASVAMGAAAADKPCHAMAMHNAHGAAAHHDGAKQPALDDCCTSPACTCSGMCLAQVAVTNPSWRPMHFPQLVYALQPEATHQAPALPHLIRPPIG